MQLKRLPKQIAKEILGSNLVFTASILVIVIAAAMTGVLIELLNPQSYYHSYGRLPSKFTQGIGELASQILQFAGPIWLLLGLPCYLLIPYPSKFWKPKNSMAVGVAIGTVGTTIDWLGMSLITAYTNANGHVTTCAYDSNGNVLTTTDASFLDAARQLSDWIMITDGSAGKCN
jgi:YD repeat-containing protein